MSIVEGFGGMRVKTTLLIFLKNSKTMESYSFKINFRNQIITVSITHFETTFSVDGTKDLTIVVNGKRYIAK
jgi:maltose phosphorylase